jgi:hypothetical protein
MIVTHTLALFVRTLYRNIAAIADVVIHTPDVVAQVRQLLRAAGLRRNMSPRLKSL